MSGWLEWQRGPAIMSECRRSNKGRSALGERLGTGTKGRTGRHHIVNQHEASTLSRLAGPQLKCARHVVMPFNR